MSETNHPRPIANEVTLLNEKNKVRPPNYQQNMTDDVNGMGNSNISGTEVEDIQKGKEKQVESQRDGEDFHGYMKHMSLRHENLVSQVMSMNFLHFLPRWKRVKEENVIARNSLAAERTMLAWVRTGIALLAIGIALGRIVGIQGEDRIGLLRITGSIFCVFALLLFFYASVRFITMNHQLQRGYFVIDNCSYFAMIVFGIIITTLALVVIFY